METVLSGITVDTTSVMAAAGIIVTAYAAMWAINKVIGVFRK